MESSGKRPRRRTTEASGPIVVPQAGPDLGAIIESAGDAIVSTDLDLRIRTWNPAAERMYGYAKAEVLGHDVRQLLQDEYVGMRPEQISARLQSIGWWRGEIRQRHKNGSPVFTLVMVSLLRDKSGAPTGYVSVNRDNSDRRAAEERLRRSESQLAEAQALAHVGSWEMELGKEHAIWSEETFRIFGLAPRAIVPDDLFLSCLHPDDRPVMVARMKRAPQIGEEVNELEVRVVHPSGQIRYVNVRARLTWENGRPTRIMGTVQDITDRRQLEARLMISDRLASMGTLAAGVAHEINNPLSYIVANLVFVTEQLDRLAEVRRYTVGMGDALEEPLVQSVAEMKQAIEEARQGADRVTRIVRDLHVFSRSDQNNVGPVDLERVLELAVKMAWNEIRHRARLVKDLNRVPPVRANEARLGQVFLNLLVNAAQAVPEGNSSAHEIRIRTQARDDGQVVIEIQDTGSGIPPEARSRIFDPFFTTKPVGVGTGLGLSICHGIVTSFGGEISVESEPGRGSTFRVTLPAAPADIIAPGSTTPPPS